MKFLGLTLFQYCGFQILCLEGTVSMLVCLPRVPDMSIMETLCTAEDSGAFSRVHTTVHLRMPLKSVGYHCFLAGNKNAPPNTHYSAVTYCNIYCASQVVFQLSSAAVTDLLKN